MLINFKQSKQMKLNRKQFKIWYTDLVITDPPTHSVGEQD